MKKLTATVLLLLHTGCASHVYDLPGIERHCMDKMKLYPSQVQFDVMFVTDQAAVSEKHAEIYGTPTNAIAFYSHRRKLVVAQENCPLRVLRHEVGHAVTSAYFKMPVPIWLHEVLARRCESD
jgi:hypothetical protein